VTRPIVAVVYAEATSPVVRAQTPPLLAAWRAAGRRVDAALFTSPRALVVPSARAAHKRAFAAFADATGVAPMKWTHAPRDRGLESLGRKLAKELVERGLADAVLFCRQPRAALVGVSAKDALPTARVVLDLRGLRDVEYLMTLGKFDGDLSPDERAQLAAYRVQEELACRRADAVLCVSRPMQKELGRRYGLDDAKLGRVPNHATPVPDAERLRATARAELRVAADAPLVAYSGSLAAWQMPDASICLFQAMKTFRPDARLFFLTPDVETARGALAAAKLDDALVASAPAGDVARLLCAADYGLLLREDSTVNRVACPVKFGEYLACGVRPLLSPHIGDQSDVASSADLGVVVGLGNPDEAARIVAADSRRPGAIDAAGRERRRAWASENIAPERAAARIAEFLDRTAGA